MSTSTSITTDQVARPKTSANVLRRVRQLHLYLGTFFAPSIIFFALTGAAQVLNLHEKTAGSTYEPPAWMEKLAQVHKKQTLAMKPKGGGPPRSAQAIEHRPEASAPSTQPGRGAPPEASASTLALKWFFFFMSVGLTATTLLGIYMAFKYNRDRRIIWGMLGVGTALPLILLFL